MGRKPTRWTNLPKGMRARPRGNKVFYYLDTGGRPRREIPLGSDYPAAVRRWAELAVKPAPAAAAGTFAQVVEAYWRDVIPTKSGRTQQDNEKERDWILRFFNTPPAPIDKIEPRHIRQYLDWRVKEAKKAAEERNAQRLKANRPPLPIKATYGQVRANREKALISHIWNYAREHGYTNLPNPCSGIKGFKEVARDVYIDDDMLRRIMEHATKPLQFALRLAHITGQRPADVRRMSEAHISDGVLHVQQGKTKAKLRLVIEGDLKLLLDEIQGYKTTRSVRALPLLVNEAGQPLSASMLRKRFDTARDAAGIEVGSFQFRDLRAKAATDTDDMGGTRAAQALLGHATETMTADYIRRKAGRKVRLLESKRAAE